MDCLGWPAQLPALLSDELTGESAGADGASPGYFSGADESCVAGVSVQDRKVDRVVEQEDVSVQEFVAKLDELLTALDKKAYIGAVRKYLEHRDGARNLLDVLPASFVDWLRNSAGEPHLPGRYVAFLLRDAVTALKHGADLQQTREHFNWYMQMMDQVCVQGIFENSLGKSSAGSVETLFEAVLDLRLCLWQGKHANISALSASLGAKPWENSEVMSCLAWRYGYVFRPAQSADEKPTDKEPCARDKSLAGNESSSSNRPADVSRDATHSRRAERFLNPLCPPWRRYLSRREPVRVMMPKSWEQPGAIPSEVEKLATLKTGFYGLGFEQYLFVGDPASSAKFSVYLSTGMQFEFQSPSALYEYLTQNCCLYANVQLLDYYPEYFTDYVADSQLPDYVSEALTILGVSQDSLSSMSYGDFMQNFRQQARQVHPDKIGDAGHDRFCRLLQAREIVEQWLPASWVDDGAQDRE